MPNSKNSTSLLYYQIGPNTFKTRSMLNLFNEIVEQPYFDSLRTQQQLSYNVENNVKNSNNILGIYFLVIHQEDNFSTKYVSERIEEFTQYKISEILTKMDDKTFEDFKKSSIKIQLAPNESLSEEVSDNWREIKLGEYMFDRKLKHAEAVPEITKDELLEFYENNFRKKNSRKLLVQICGPGAKEESEEESDTILIENSFKFKNSMYVLPVYKANQ